uniref:Uncharacterized protein n=1 Tax=Leersia perrieri TaxID=77586 RepID=A0A0D9XR53_9ORYZ
MGVDARVLRFVEVAKMTGRVPVEIGFTPAAKIRRGGEDDRESARRDRVHAGAEERGEGVQKSKPSHFSSIELPCIVYVTTMLDLIICCLG